MREDDRMDDDVSSEDSIEAGFCAPMPSSGKRKAAAKRAPKKKKRAKRKPKFRVMIVFALKKLKSQNPDGSKLRDISRIIEEKYKVKNDFVLKQVLTWMCKKKVLQRKGLKFKPTGKKLKLLDNVITGKPHKRYTKRRKSKARRGRR